MKKSDKLSPCCFDDRDVIVDGDLWKFFLDNSNLYIPYCVSYNDKEAMFYLANNPYLATIVGESYCINVRPVKGDHFTNPEDIKLIEECFGQWNNEDENDIFVRFAYGRYGKTHDIKTIHIHFYHTDI